MKLELTDTQARHLAQFLKRVGFADFERCARDQDEAYAMQEAAGGCGERWPRWVTSRGNKSVSKRHLY